eukprot:m51a1_g5713 hypothetical protein (309) ;mRNA; r:1089013-1089939
MSWSDGVPRYECELVADSKCKLGEGPHWSHRDRLLYWVDIEGRRVHSLDPRSPASPLAYALADRPSLVVRRSRAAPELLVAAEHALCSLDTRSQRVERLAGVEVPEGPPQRWNDGKCDAQGRLVAGMMCDVRPRLPVARVYSATAGAGGSVSVRAVEAIGNVTTSNGLAWDDDGRHLYHIDTPTGLIRRWGYDAATGEVSGPAQTVVEKPKEITGVLDGMARDAAGGLWVALHRTGAVARWDGASGKLLGVVEVPAANVTSCCWGGDALDELYITSAADGDAAHPLAGGVFRVKVPGLRGTQSNEFSG